MLGFGQIGLATAELLFRLLCSRDVRHSPDKLHIAGCSYSGPCQGVQVLHRAVRHQQSVFMLEILMVSQRLIDYLLHGSAIFWMGALNDEARGRFRCRIVLKNTIGLL